MTNVFSALDTRSRNSIGRDLTCQALSAAEQIKLRIDSSINDQSFAPRSAFNASVNAFAASSADTVTSSTAVLLRLRARS